MANYGINIDVKVKAGQLTNFNRTLDQTDDKIKKVNEKLKGITSLIPKSIKPLTQSFNDLSAVVTKANAAFNKSTLGTPQATQAARNLVRANEEFNIGLEKRAKLLEKVTFEMKMQKLAERGIRPGTASSTPFGPMPMMTVNNNPRIMRNIAASQAARQDTNFGFGLAGDPVAKSIRRNQEKREKLLKKELKVRQNILQVEKLSLGIASAEQSTRAFGVSGGQIGPALPQGFRLRQQFKQGGMFGMPGGMKSRIKGGVGSAMIGGGFPALFGAGGLSSVMGGVAGGLGGALAPGGGFAASIAATAIAAQIEKAKEFNKTIKDLNRSIAATGGQSQFTAEQVKEFAKSMRMTKEEALEALKAFEQFGAAARISLTKVFGNEATFNMLASLKDNASILDRMDEITKSLGFEQAGLVLQILDTQGARAAENKILELTVKKNKELNMQIKERVGAEGRLRKIRKEQRTEEELKVQQEIDNAKTILDLQTKRLEQQERLAIIKAPIDEMEKLSDVLFQVDALGKSIGDSFSESFKGLIKGSMTAQEALRNLFQRTADHFLDMAAQMLAAQIRSGIFGLFSSLITPAPTSTFNPAPGTFGTNIPSGADLPAGSFNVSPSLNRVRGTAFKADGGPVMKGGSYIVGERGPEMFSPGVSGMITPNHALGGETNVIVNVDASGSSVEGDEQKGKELGRLISVAIQSELIQQKRPGGLLS